jgi:hypothetical protein
MNKEKLKLLMQLHCQFSSMMKPKTKELEEAIEKLEQQLAIEIIKATEQP